MTLAATSLDEAFRVFVLIAARVTPAVVLLPFFGGASLPLILRLGMGGGLAAWLCAVLPVSAFWGGTDGHWPWLLVREVAIGFVLAWLASLVFKAAEVAGHVADLGRRADGPTLVDPLDASNEGLTPLSVLFGLLAVVLFCALGGPAHFISALARTYEVLPLQQSLKGTNQPVVWAVVAQAVGGMLEAAVAMAAPVLLAVWLSEVVVALASRVAGSGGVDLSNLVRASSPLLGLGAVLLSLGLVRAALEGALARVPSMVLHTLSLWASGA
ncbi:MAG: flagellar biosynthetic protein FliR [Deltaproteobacteria bacterium]|nr:flagellar biosynthetic protein FliR [Deltaproteobacteria bacterium]